MIVSLNHRDPKVAWEMWNVQIPAYRVEASLIGFQDLPPLKETAESIMDSDEHAVGYRVDEELAGFISYMVEEDVVDICKLVVHPAQFRKGIATKLLDYVANGIAAHAGTIIVSTGAQNTPAKELYKRFGFVETGNIEVAPGFYITNMEKSKG